MDSKVIAEAVNKDRKAIDQLQSSYLGFIVVKPLPSTVIGRTCLVTYGNKDRERNFPTVQNYPVHILGIELNVSSLPFQEQDTDVAACATSALWSVFNSTGRIFQHSIPSPAEITKAATASQRAASRTLPAGDGLSAEQIADAIRSVGLEPLYIGTKNLELLLVAACAYLREGTPCLLLGAITEAVGKKKLRQLGLHAIALAGYNIPKNRPQKYSKQSGTLFAATGIERLYAHDDQVGPFSRIRVDRKARLPLGTSWPDGNRIRGNIFFDPQILLVPLYHKIRVPIMSMISIVLALDLWIETARIAGIVPLATRVEWDVFLIENARLKSGLFEDQQVLSDFRSKVLMSDMPRYIWRVSAATNNIKQFDILFDATDLLQGGHVLGVLPYVKDVCVAVAAIAQNPHAMASIKSTGNRGLELTLSWFADNAALF